MNLLITPAISLTPQQQAQLEAVHTLYFLEDERIPLNSQNLSFDPHIIEGIICNFFFQNNPLSALPNLRLIQLTSVGLDRVPLDEIHEKNIALFNAGSVYAVPMAEWAVSMLLGLCKHSAFFFRNQEKHLWQKHRAIRELAGSRVGIIGFGNVGKKIGQRLKAFDTHICAVDIAEDLSGIADAWYPISDLKSVLEQSDIIILTLPLLDSTYHILNAEMLSAMQDDAILINVARGKLIDEKALIHQLNSGRFWGVALDVFEEEPLSSDSPLWDFDRVILTPHNSFVGNGNSTRLFDAIWNNLMK